MGRPSSFQGNKMAEDTIPKSDVDLTEDEFKALQDTSIPKAPATKPKRGQVQVRVMKLGHDRIHTGESVNGVDTKFQRGDKFAIDRSIAEEHEDKGWVEIL
jgi:hypothetical protein